MWIENCKIIELKKISDPRGNLTVIENGPHLPFEIKRFYYLYDVPEGIERGGHGHVELEQLIIALSGSFDVILDDGRNKFCFHLNCPSLGLYITPMIWRDINNFSPGSVCAVLASEVYKESDYLRNYDDYIVAREAYEHSIS